MIFDLAITEEVTRAVNNLSISDTHKKNCIQRYMQQLNEVELSALGMALVPGDFIHVIGDAHVYKTHVRALQEQLQKQPKPFPILKINLEKKDIDSFEASDFKLVGYHPHLKIEMKMAVLGCDLCITWD